MFSGFTPYVGQNYWNGGPSGLRLLILGESHYGGTKNEYPEFTQWVVEKYGRQDRHRFFTSVQKVVQGIERGHWLPDEQRARFWSTVAFYNYVQSIVGAKPRARPTEVMWQGGKPPFLSLLESLRPQILLVLGQELDRHLPSLPPNIWKCPIRHPSSRGFRLDVAQQRFRSSLSALSGNF